jgi:hypothetical protein
MRKFGTILTALFMTFAIVQAQEAPKEKDAKKMEFTGTLRAGIIAIGGETTGYVIETKKGMFELTFGTQKALQAKADKLDGKTVLVTGTLEIRKGVEVKERKIVTVISLEEAKAK